VAKSPVATNCGCSLKRRLAANAIEVGLHVGPAPLSVFFARQFTPRSCTNRLTRPPPTSDREYTPARSADKHLPEAHWCRLSILSPAVDSHECDVLGGLNERDVEHSGGHRGAEPLGGGAFLLRNGLLGFTLTAARGCGLAGVGGCGGCCWTRGDPAGTWFGNRKNGCFHEVWGAKSRRRPNS
jgi:hypothetical protein